MKLNMKAALLKLDGAVSKSTLYEAIKRCRIPHFRISGGGRRGKIVIEESDLLAWLDEQKVEKGASDAPEALTHIRLSPAGPPPANAKSGR